MSKERLLYSIKFLAIFICGMILQGSFFSFIIDDELVVVAEETPIDEETWYRTFVGRYNDIVRSVINTDSGFIIVGDTESFNGPDKDIWLIGTDDNGYEQWNKIIGSDWDESCVDILQSSDGNYFLIANKDIRLNDRLYIDILILKIDPSGNIIWERTFGGKESEYCTEALLTQDGGIILFGVKTPNLHKNDNWTNSLWFMKVSENGQEEWNRTIDTNYNFHGSSILETSENNILVAITIYEELYSKKTFLLNINKDGLILWERTIAQNSTFRSPILLSTDNSDFYLRWSIESQYIESDSIIIQFNSTGFETWNKTLDYNDTGLIRNIRKTSDDGYVIVGSIWSPIHENYDVKVLKVDSNFTILWNRSYDYGLAEHGLNIINTTDGGYVIIGYTSDRSNTKYDILLIKIDSNGDTIQRTKDYQEPYFFISNPKSHRNVNETVVIEIELGNTDIIFEKVEVRIDLGYWTLMNGSDSWYYEWDTKAFNDGEHTIYIRAFDGFYYHFRYINVMVENIKDNNDNFKSSVNWIDFTNVTNEHIYYITRSSDGGYIITGSQGNYPVNVLLIKFDSHGRWEWERNIGDGDDEWGEKVIQTRDSGYCILGGYISVPEGCGGKEHTFCGSILILRTDSEGAVVWVNKLNLGLPSYKMDFEETTDGGFIIVGTSGNDTRNTDIILIKINSEGNVEWNKSYNISKSDKGYTVMQTSDGGYIIGGSYNGPSLLRIDSKGNLLWYKSYYGFNDVAIAFQTIDGGFILAYNNDEIDDNYDINIVKTDIDGNELWRKTFGGVNSDRISDMQQTSDGGYIITGLFGKFSDEIGSSPWFIKLDENGELEWEWISSNRYCCRSPSYIVEDSEGSYVAYGEFLDMDQEYDRKNILIGINQELPQLNFDEESQEEIPDEDDDIVQSEQTDFNPGLVCVIVIAIFVILSIIAFIYVVKRRH
jgi:hypothetical protein